MSYGAQILVKSLEMPQQSGSGDYFYSPMQLVGEWDDYTETICSVDPSGRGTDETAAAFLSQRNGFIYLHEMSAYRDGYSIVPCSTSLEDAESMELQAWLLRQTLEMES